MKRKLYKVAVLAVAGMMLLAIPAASQEEDRPDDPGPQANDDVTTQESQQEDDVSVDGQNFDDWININNPDHTGLVELNLNGESPCCTDTWRLLNNADESHQFELREGASTIRMVMDQGGNMGLGTTAPLSPLHINRFGGFQLRLQGSGADYRIDAFDTNLRIGASANTNQFRIFGADAPIDALVVRDGIGIGTQSPGGDLHVTDVDGSGRTELRVENASAGTTWSNQVLDTSGHYTFNRLGSGGPEFLVRERQHPTATLDVDGPVRASVYNTSSKELKTNNRDVDSGTMLGKLNRLPISSWQFKACKDGEGRIERLDGTQPPPCSGEGQGPRHVGPMAEDFQDVFGLGDGESISTMTADGIMMLSIQELTQQLEAKEQAISDLEGKVEDLEARLNALERGQG